MSSTDELSYRFPMPVTHYRCEGNKKVPVCPRCLGYLKTTYNFCGFCGQRLGWADYWRAEELKVQ